LAQRALSSIIRINTGFTWASPVIASMTGEFHEAGLQHRFFMLLPARSRQR